MRIPELTSPSAARESNRTPRVPFRAWAALGSLRFTLMILVGLIGACLVILRDPSGASSVLAAPLALLAVNLLAAVSTHPLFRRQAALLVFHLALLALVLLAAAGRLTYLKGWVEVSENAEFEGRLHGYTAGPLHPWHLEKLRFRNEGFDILYDQGPRRTDTYNEVSWTDGAGEPQRRIIGDQYPLVLEGYRFYTSFNKGFAPTFTWQPADGGDRVRGDLHLPAYPMRENRQTATWRLPGTDREIWVLLRFEEAVLTSDRPSVFRAPVEHRLVVRFDEHRQEVRPGGHLQLPEGRLEYEGLGVWMGYTVFYDWTRPWLVGASLLAVAALGWHLQARFRRAPWMREEKVDG